MKKSSFYICLLFCLCFLAVGCGPKTARVSGRVTFDGTPAKDISVLFQAISSDGITAEPAFGKTNGKGEFTLALMNTKKKGAIPGEYAVYISWVDPEPGDVIEGAKDLKPIPYKIPPRASSGEMTFTVTEEGTTEANFDFETSKESYKPSGV